MRVLFVTGTRIGDAILSTGVLAHLLDTLPRARFTVACGPLAAPLFAAVPRLDRVVVMAKRKDGGHWLKLWAYAVLRPWSRVVDLRGSLVAYLVWTRARAVKTSKSHEGHVVEELARVAGLAEPPGPRLWTAPEHWAQAARLLPDGPPVLALAPVANWRGKEWPIERFAELALRLTGPNGILPGGRIAVFGAAEDRARAEALFAALPAGRTIDLMTGFDLLTAHECLRRTALFVGNDSGTMHLAAASGVRTLGLFGPSKDQLYRPWGPRGEVVRTPESFDELVGRPGYDHRTTGSLMGSLAVEAVEIAARALWRREGGAR